MDQTMMMDSPQRAGAFAGAVSRLQSGFRWLEQRPWSVAAIPMRLAAFSVFWRSGTVKLSDWASTVALFGDEYRVPLLPPALATTLATTTEISCAVLLLLGLATRFAVLGLFGVIAVIQIFVYPTAWPDHIQWFAFLFPLFLRGPGAISCDNLIGGRMRRSLAP
jgi:putative oxidoreductase